MPPRPSPSQILMPHALDRLVEVACSAGQEILRFYRQPRKVHLKSDGSPLTAADRAAHRSILRDLEAWTPDIPVISEEGAVPSYDERQGWSRFWLVDPLDGTKEFIAENGEFTVNIALIEGGRPALGVVVAPALDTVYFAARGAGAWRREREGCTTRLRGARPASNLTRIVESRSHPSPELEAFVATLGPVERIKVGSSLKFCRVAEGAADLYPRFGRTMEWDVAAGDCVYRYAAEAGCERPSPLTYNQPGLSAPGFVIGQAGGPAAGQSPVDHALRTRR